MISAHSLEKDFEVLHQLVFPDELFRPKNIIRMGDTDILIVAGDKRMMILQYTEAGFSVIKNFENLHNSNF